MRVWGGAGGGGGGGVTSGVGRREVWRPAKLVAVMG